jgi:hypothetical protein
MNVFPWGLGFGIGAAVVLVNFWALGVSVRSVLQPGAKAPRLLAAMGFGARLLAAGLIMGLALRYLPANPIAMLLGVSVLPIALLVKALVGYDHLASKVI